MSLKKYITETNVFLVSLTICILVLLVPHLLRYAHGNFTIIGDMSYYHLRMSQTIMETKEIPSYDPLSLTNRIYRFEPYHVVLAGLGFIIGLETASFTLPFMLGILSFIVLYLILRRIKINLEQRALIVFILLLSPIFIYTYTISNEFSCGIFVLLLGFYLFMNKNSAISFVSVVLFMFSSLFGLENTFIALIIMAAYALLHKDKLKSFFAVGAILIVFSAYYYGIFYYHFGFQIPTRFNLYYMIKEFLSDLGSLTGFSVFAIFLGIIGVLESWKDKKKFSLVYLLMIVLIVLSWYSSQYALYLNFFISIFAGIGFIALIKMRWSLEYIKQLTLLVLACGLIFSATSYVIRLANEQPTPAIREALTWLQQNSNANEIVFSDPSRGFWIEYFAQRYVYADELITYSLDYATRVNISQSLFYGRRLMETSNLLKTNGISYIFIDDEMKKGLVWEKDKQGLLYLLRNNETFKNLYTQKGIEIWKYIG